MMFNDLYWIVHQLGFAGDTLCCFLNLHVNRIKNYKLVKGRARCSSPGVLLNWAWYYPKWYRSQKKNPNLYKQIFYIQGLKQFSQAHFFNHENELLETFPGYTVVTLLSRSTNRSIIYNKWAHFKLLDKKLYASRYETQKQNFPLTITQNRQLADSLYNQGLTVGQYRCIAHMDWKGLTLDDLDCDPVQFWHCQSYLQLFQENLNTVMINNDYWYPYFDPSKQRCIFIDQLADPLTEQLDDDYYFEICDQLQLVPDIDFYHEFWQHWFAQQPPKDYNPDLSWPFD